MNTKHPLLYSLILALALLESCACFAAETELPKWALGPFVRPETAKPVIQADASVWFNCPMQQKPVRWQARRTFNPAAVARDGKIFVLYRAEDDTGEMRIVHHTSRIGLAESTDGIHFTQQLNPVLFPKADSQISGEWSGGCEDPRVVEGEYGVYVMTYNQWNRKERHLAIATSVDLVHWDKHGPAFARALNGKYASIKGKSGAIVCELNGDCLKAAKIHDKYWMYWGAGVVSLAHSGNLIDWTIVEDNRGDPISLLQGSAGHFDSSMVEVGPPALVTEKGVIVFYNGQNLGQEAPMKGDPELANGAYSAGQALFDNQDLTQLIGRTNSAFLKPELPHEKNGLYAAGATFIEGLVYVNGKWFLYYSCADSTVGVAIYDWAAP